jgi:hypothetical protein
MNHKPEPASEISPDHQISPPIYAKPGTNIPQHVIDANNKATSEINQAKDAFISQCLTIVHDIDPEKIQLNLRNDFSPTIIIPSGNSPDQKKQVGHLRHTGHTLTFNYDNRWVGTMEIQYNHDGTISINTTTK